MAPYSLSCFASFYRSGLRTGCSILDFYSSVLSCSRQLVSSVLRNGYWPRSVGGRSRPPPCRPAEQRRLRRCHEACCRGRDNNRLALSARNLDKSFGGIHAVRGFDLSVHDKTLHALIGPNGAGKTTAFNVLSGLYRPDARFGRTRRKGPLEDLGQKISRGLVSAVRFRSPICLPA